MALFDKLKEVLDKAGRAAQGALDEGKIRIEAFRTRQLADKAAQSVGYAVFRARQNGGEVDSDTYTRLSATLATHDAEAAKCESQLEELKKQSRGWGASSSSAPHSSQSEASAEPTPSTHSPASPEVGTPPEAQDISG